MQSIIIDSSTQYSIVGSADPLSAQIVTFKTVGLTASCSVIPKVRKAGAGTSNLIAVPYFNVNTDADVAANTAITADGVYRIAATGPEIILDATVSSGTATISYWIISGAAGAGGGSGGGGGGAVTVADGADVTLGAKADAAITDSTTTNTAMSFVKGLVKILADVWVSASHYLKTAITDGTTVVGVDAGTSALNVNIAKDSTAAPTTPLPVSSWDQTLTNQQTIKAASTAIAATDIPAAVGLHPSSPLPAGTNHLGEVGGNSLSLESTLTVTASSAYSAGNCVGGLVTLTNAMRISGGTGVLQNLLVVDHSHQNPNLDLIFFKSTPAATFTDKSAFPTLSQADDALVVCRVSIASTDWVTIGGSGFASPTFQPKVVAASGSANLLMAINTSSTPTFGATTDLMVTTGFLRD